MKDISVSGHIVQAYLICARQAWLMSRQVIGDQYNDFMAIGRLLSNESYKKEKKEIRVGSSVIDIVSTRDNGVMLVEVKKSSKAIEASIMQLKFYMYTLKNKVQCLSGEVRIPKEKKIFVIEMNDELVEEVESVVLEIETLLYSDKPPSANWINYCRTCSQQDFCWS